MKKSCKAAISCSLIILFSAAAADAGSGTWLLNPGSGDWNTATNWTSATVPNGLADTATFTLSNMTAVSISANTTVDGITFLPGASAYHITVNPMLTLTVSGVGITNGFGATQNFITTIDSAGHVGEIDFTNSATAGNMTTFANNRGGTRFFNTSTAGGGTFTNSGATINGFSGGFVQFFDASTAANGAFTNNGGGAVEAAGGIIVFQNTSTAANATFVNKGATSTGGFGGETVFEDSSTAGNGIFTNNGGAASGLAALGGGNTVFFNTSRAANATFINNAATASGAESGVTEFGSFPSSGLDSPSAANATFINNGAAVSGAVGGKTVFYETSTADAATLIANGGINGGGGGEILFAENSTGGTPRVEVFGNGFLDISPHLGPPAAPSMPGSVTIGSIEGDGNVFLGANNLTVGSNNMSTTLSGVIQDGGQAGGVGGSLTKIGSGTLTVSGSNTYTGDTTVSGGTLLVNNSTGSGTGTGAVHVIAGTLGGTGTIAGAVTVGTGTGTGAFISPGTSPGTLTIQSSLTLNSDATYKFELNSTSAAADKIVANGVNLKGAAFSFTDLGNAHLTLGTIFVVIDNTSSTAITGLFANLADNSTFTNNGNTYQVSYEGGTGNDLTFIVVPEPPSWKIFCIGVVSIAALLARRNQLAR